MSNIRGGENRGGFILSRSWRQYNPRILTKRGIREDERNRRKGINWGDK